MAVVFGIIYSVFNFFRNRVSLKTQFAGVYAKRFKDEFISDANVFDTYLTKIYKACKINQLSAVIFAVISFVLVISIFEVVNNPLKYYYCFSDSQINNITDFMTSQFNIKSGTGLSFLNTIFENKLNIALIDNVPKEINTILITSPKLFSVNFLQSASFNSPSIILPLIFFGLYIKNVVKGIIRALKEKTKKTIILAILQSILLISIVTSCFFLPLIYYTFIIIYQVINILSGLITKKCTGKYIERIKLNLKPVCDEIYEEAKAQYEKDNKELETVKN